MTWPWPGSRVHESSHDQTRHAGFAGFAADARRLPLLQEGERAAADAAGQGFQADGAGDSGVRLRPTVVDGVLYADSTDGKLAAFDAATGKTLWSKSSRTHGWFG